MKILKKLFAPKDPEILLIRGERARGFFLMCIVLLIVLIMLAPWISQ